MSYFIDANATKRNDTALLSDNYINKKKQFQNCVWQLMLGRVLLTE